jgi:hypothetical protein
MAMYQKNRHIPDNRIGEVLEKIGKDITWLSKKVGKPRSTVYKHVNGPTKTNTAILKDYAEALNIEPSELLPDANSKNKQHFVIKTHDRANQNQHRLKEDGYNLHGAPTPFSRAQVAMKTMDRITKKAQSLGKENDLDWIMKEFNESMEPFQ